MRQKVLVLTPFYFPNVGGAESFAYDLVQELKKRYKVDICTIKWNGQKTFKGTGLGQFIEVFPRLFLKAFHYCLWTRYERIYALGLNSALIASILKVFFRIKVFSVLLALYDFKGKSALFRGISRLALRLSNKVFVEGLNGKEDLACLKLNNIVIFQHWCDQTRFFPIKKNSKKLQVLFIGRDFFEKGKHIIKAVEYSLKDENVEFTYVEKVPFKKLAKIYQMADVVTVPSLYAEGLTRVVIESASCGCSVIASNRGSLPEQVLPFGMVVEPDVESFKAVIQFLVCNKKSLRTIQKKTSVYAKENFNNKNAKIFL